MTPGGKSYITYRGRRYKSRERRLEATFGEGDCVPVVNAEEEEPMAEERDEGKEFGKSPPEIYAGALEEDRGDGSEVYRG